ncbi:MAG: RDD family protein [Candidatus Altiarchaeota archaeon]|nr:RDD family protein [Candidatus Altiarchaeota archaeon]
MTNTDLLIKRAVAIIIDSIILGIILSVITVIVVVMGVGTASVAEGYARGIVILTVFTALGVLILLSLLYYIVLEGPKGRGQTLGKKIMKIKVTHEDGNVPSYTQAAIRTVLRIVDGMFFHIIGVVVICISEKDQRIGDIAAKTVVVDA